MEELVNDRLLQDTSRTEASQTSSSPSTSAKSIDSEKRRLPRKSLEVSGPVQSYHPQMKNFWYPVAFSTDLKDDTMVCPYLLFFMSYTYHISVVNLNSFESTGRLL